MIEINILTKPILKINIVKFLTINFEKTENKTIGYKINKIIFIPINIFWHSTFDTALNALYIISNFKT